MTGANGKRFDLRDHEDPFGCRRQTVLEEDFVLGVSEETRDRLRLAAFGRASAAWQHSSKEAKAHASIALPLTR
jgi:hypothetical protein